MKNGNKKTPKRVLRFLAWMMLGGLVGGVIRFIMGPL